MNQFAPGKIGTGVVLFWMATLLVSGSLGFFLGQKGRQSTISNGPNLNATLPTTKIGASSLITSQEAVAVGKITKVNNNSITMQGDDGKVSGFKLAPNFNIYPQPGSTSASASAIVKPSQNVNDIKLNQKYQVHLFLQGSEFLVISIQELPKSVK